MNKDSHTVGAGTDNGTSGQISEPICTRRTVAAPFGEVGLPTVDPAEVAEVAAAALREDGHCGHVYELTGPALVTPRQQAAAIGEAISPDVERLLGRRPRTFAEWAAGAVTAFK